MRIKGFTLVEVLITIGIIGIVAALTITNLIVNYQKKQTAQRLKLIYTQLEQAIKLSEAENDDITGWNYEVSPKVFFDQYLLKHIKIIKTKSYNKLSNEVTYKALSGRSTMNNLWVMRTPVDVYTTLNGTDILLTKSSSKGSYVGSTGKEIFIDLNGVNNPPNQSGKDFFCLTLSKLENRRLYLKGTYGGDEYTFADNPNRNRNVLLGKTAPKSGGTSNYPCSRSSATSLWCSRLIQIDGWEIKPDYPW